MFASIGQTSLKNQNQLKEMKKLIISLSLSFALIAPSLADSSLETSAQGNGAEGVRFVEAKAEVDRLRKDKPDSSELHNAQMRLEMIINQAEVQTDQRAARAY